MKNPPIWACLMSCIACAGTLDGDGSGAALTQETAPGFAQGQAEPLTLEMEQSLCQGRRIMKLSPAQYEASVHQLIPGAKAVADRLAEKIAGTSRFSSAETQLDLSVPYVERLIEITDELADQALSLPTVQQCLVAVAGSDCWRTLIQTLVTQASRRPVAEAELERYVALLESETAIAGPEHGVRQLFRALLLAPESLFRTELGPDTTSSGVVPLTAHERASALSYLVTGKPPDAELFSAAESGQLTTPEQVATQAARLASEAGAAGIVGFFAELLQSESVLHSDKDETLFPDFTDEVRLAMLQETREFVGHVLWQGDATLSSLLTEPKTLLNPTLADFYGIPQATDGFVMTELPGQIRAGLLTQGSLMATLADNAESHIIRRGKFIRETFLCGAIPPPPAEAINDFPQVDQDQPQVARLGQHRSNPACAACHEFMDPIGKAFEHFDAVGRYRTEDHGVAIDPSGYIVQGGGGETISFDNVADLARQLATLPEVRTCLSTFVWEYALGGQNCVDPSLVGRVGPLNIKDLFVEIARSPAFLNRRL